MSQDGLMYGMLVVRNFRDSVEEGTSAEPGRLDNFGDRFGNCSQDVGSREAAGDSLVDPCALRSGNRL